MVPAEKCNMIKGCNGRGIGHTVTVVCDVLIYRHRRETEFNAVAAA